MQASTTPSAHVCTTPHKRKYQPRNYGHVSAGEAETVRLSPPSDQRKQLLRLAERVARLNPDSTTIGAGMLASLVADARCALGQEGRAK